MTTKRERADDPDETEGRAIYRAQAEYLARASISMALHPVKMIEEVTESRRGSGSGE